jgi:hypothetical protein
MSYMHIENLYKNGEILNFKECYAMEKIHGTSAHISYKAGRVSLFAGGGSYPEFCKLFDITKIEAILKEKFGEGDISVHVYGEYYGGKLQGMSPTYGKEVKFVAFEVKVGDHWLNVPKAEIFAVELGLDFVHYVRIPTTLEELDRQRDADSIQAVKNGMGSHKREGIVIRPLEEYTDNNGERIIAKHKAAEFCETVKVPKVGADLELIAEAKAIADNWVTAERLKHILDGIEPKIENTGKVIQTMVEDIMREGEGEVVDSKEARKEIGKATAIMFKRLLS